MRRAEPSSTPAPRLYGGGVLEFAIPGTPIAKGRPRMTKTGHTYTPERTRAAESVVAEVVRLMECIPIAGPIQVELDFFLPVPARFNRRDAESALLGAIRPVGRPDLDNLAKLVCDAIQGEGPGHAFASDAQICQMTARKWYGTPRTMVRVVGIE